MADIISNITIDITGNTASMGTDYGTNGLGLTATHVPMSKVVWGDSTEGKRVTLTDPLPIQFAGQTGPLDISGNVGGATNASFQIRNYGTDGSGASAALHYIAVAGNTLGTERVGITGTVQGMVDGTPLTVTGDIRIAGSLHSSRGVAIQGTSAGATASVNGEVYPGYGFGIPVAVTGGRRLNSTIDSVTVSGTVNSTGGRQLSPSTDAVAMYGYDQGKSIHTMLRVSNDGLTAGWSGDALKVAVTNIGPGGITFNSSVLVGMGVTNAGEPPLRIQGYTASAQADPVIVRGENNGALEITATSALNTTVSNIVTINDDDIIASLENSEKPLINTLSDIESNTDQISEIRADLASGAVKATISSITRPSDVRAGNKSITSTTEALHTNMEMRSGVTVKSSPLSNGNMLIGHRGLINNTDNGYLLEPGESIFIEVNNLNKVFLRLAPGSGTSSATVYYIGT